MRRTSLLAAMTTPAAPIPLALVRDQHFVARESSGGEATNARERDCATVKIPKASTADGRVIMAAKEYFRDLLSKAPVFLLVVKAICPLPSGFKRNHPLIG